MIKDSSERLLQLCSFIPAWLRQVSEEEFLAKPSADKWSKKEILGHLIDSAANNHQRFIRIQFEDTPQIFYDQNNWVAYNHYQEADTNALISLWQVYNQHLAFVMQKVPEQNLSRRCKMRDGRLVTVEWLIDDYVTHLEHHLKQITNY